MSYAAAVALQTAVYEVLRQDAGLTDLVGDAIYDAMPVSAPSGVYVALGTEETRDAGDMTGAGVRHDFIVSVLTGTADTGGFGGVKAAAAAISDALEQARIILERGHLVGMWLLRAKARRVENGAGRRVDLIFRARIDLG